MPVRRWPLETTNTPPLRREKARSETRRGRPKSLSRSHACHPEVTLTKCRRVEQQDALLRGKRSTDATTVTSRSTMDPKPEAPCSRAPRHRNGRRLDFGNATGPPCRRQTQPTTAIAIEPMLARQRRRRAQSGHILVDPLAYRDAAGCRALFKQRDAVLHVAARDTTPLVTVRIYAGETAGGPVALERANGQTAVDCFRAGRSALPDGQYNRATVQSTRSGTRCFSARPTIHRGHVQPP